MYGRCVWTIRKTISKDFQDEAITKITRLPVYKRRNNGKTVHVATHEVDNRFVVPYNKYLLRKYHTYINVEVCSSLKSVKILIQTYKGHDCAMIEVRNNIEDNNALNIVDEHNEVKQYLSCRCVFPPKAFWRLPNA